MSAYKEVRLNALKSINEANLMASVAKNSMDSVAYNHYNKRAMQFEDIATYCKQKENPLNDDGKASRK